MYRTETARRNSITELAQVLGHTGSVWYNECQVFVKIVDVKLAYGQVRYLVEPLAGNGQTWIADTTITLDEESSPLS